MRLTLGSYEVEIKAKYSREGERFNKEFTYAFLNEISMVYDYAAEHFDDYGDNGVSRDYRAKSKTIFEALKELGYYK